MKESLRLSLDQKLQQRLSPLQMRYARMLEMTEPEVEEEVRRELDDNPALVEAEHDSGDDTGFNETSEEMQLADYRDEDDIPAYRLESRNRSVNDTYYEPVAVAAGESLMDNLMSQLSETDMDDRQLSIARYIIGNLDDNGYMTRSIPEIEDDLAFGAGIDVAPGEVKGILDTIRSLDPAGVGAYDLRDCLALQLRRLPQSMDVDNARAIVDHYFDLFSLRHFDRLESAMKISREDLRRAEDVIRSLNPKPAGRFSDSDVDDRTRHIIPDFVVEADDDGNLTVSMPGSHPDLTIERSFAAADDSMSKPDRDTSQRRRDAMLFISRKRDDAADFIELLRMRRVTLMRIMEAIVKYQKKFFMGDDDESSLRPMILKDIAAMTGSDLSVISRATAGKYVATQSGIYPLKFFFNEKVGREDSSSSRELAAMIKRMIDSEDTAAPLSDDAITSGLNEAGYDIARRTVAKYREKLGYPVARLRKKL